MRDLIVYSRCLATSTLCACLIGCADTLVGRDALNLAGSVEYLREQQVLENLGRFIVHRKSIASQIDINKGSAQTTYTAQLGLSIPYGNEIVRGSAGTVTAITAPTQSITPMTSITRQEYWELTPLNDSIRLGNLSAVYRYVVYADKAELQSSYRFPTKSDGSVDPTYLVTPNCVFCAISTSDWNTDPYLKDLSQNAPLHTDMTDITPLLPRPNKPWLYYTGIPGNERPPPVNLKPNDLHSLGKFGGSNLVMTKGDYDNGAFDNLILLLLPPPAVAPSPGK